MSRPRRQPPLFEFLGGRGAGVEGSRRPAPQPEQPPMASPNASPSVSPARGASPAHSSATYATQSPPLPSALRAPVQVEIKRAQQAGSRSAPGLSKSSALQRRWVFWGSIGAASLVVILALLFTLGYHFGRQDEQATLKPYIADQPGDSRPNSANGGSVQPQPVQPPSPDRPLPSPQRAQENQEKPAIPDPTPPALPALGTDTRKPGMNYLELCTLTYRDAVQAVEFLGANGLKAGMAPAQKGVDPAKAAANNLPHVIFLADGVPSDRFRATEGERARLSARVEQVGRKFQKDLRGASDFSRPMWRLFKE